MNISKPVGEKDERAVDVKAVDANRVAVEVLQLPKLLHLKQPLKPQQLVSSMMKILKSADD